MKLYRAIYDIQNSADLQTRLSETFELSEETDIGTVYVDESIDIIERRYVHQKRRKKLIEDTYISALYPICSLLLVFGAFFQLIGTRQYSVISMSVTILLSIGGLGLFSYPLLLSRVQPDAFFSPDKSIYKLFQTPDLLPVLFRYRLSFSKLVYLNGVLTLVIATPIIMPEFSITIIVILVILTVFLPLITSRDSNPATRIVITLAIISNWPFGLCLANIHFYSQYPIFVTHEQSIATAVDTLSIVKPIDLSQWLIVESLIIRILLSNILTVIGLWYLISKLKSSIIQMEGVYQASPLITDQILVRIAMVFLLTASFTLPIIILIFSILGSPIVVFESVIEVVILYWPIITIVPLSTVSQVLNNHKEKKKLAASIESGTQLSQINQVPVLTADIGSSSAIPVQFDNQKCIIINKKLKDELNQEEILSICYHELYHLKNKTQRLREISEIPILGYLLFFVFVNPSSIHKEEFRADDYAAENVSKDAIISALKKAESMELGPSTIEQIINENRWKLGINLFYGLPIIQFYRPERRARINRLHQTASAPHAH